MTSIPKPKRIIASLIKVIFLPWPGPHLNHTLTDFPGPSIRGDTMTERMSVSAGAHGPPSGAALCATAGAANVRQYAKHKTLVSEQLKRSLP